MTGVIQLATLQAIFHTPTHSLMACVFFARMMSSSEELLETVGSIDDVISEDDFGPSPPPVQITALQVQDLAAELAAAQAANRAKKVAADDKVRRSDAAKRLAAAIGRFQPQIPHPLG